MKALFIMGTPRRGNTYEVAGAVERELRDGVEGLEVRYLWPKDYSAPHCLSCYQCFDKGEEHCPHYKDYQVGLMALMEADLVVLCSPVFSLQISSDLKNFIDHLSFKFHRTDCLGKKGLAIVTTAGAGHKDGTKYLSKVMGHWGMDKCYELPVQCMSLNYELSEKVSSEVVSVSKKISEDLNQKRIYPGNLYKAFLFHLWKSLSVNNPNPENADRKFWEPIKASGLDYYPTGRLLPHTRLTAKVLWRMMAHLIASESKV